MRPFPEVMTPEEAAVFLSADPKTVARWSDRGKLHPFFTPGGHRRFWAAELKAVKAGQETWRRPGRPAPSGSPLIGAGDVAVIFRAAPKSVMRWGLSGKLRVVRTPGGQVRFWRGECEALVFGGKWSPEDEEVPPAGELLGHVS